MSNESILIGRGNSSEKRNLENATRGSVSGGNSHFLKVGLTRLDLPPSHLDGRGLVVLVLLLFSTICVVPDRTGMTKLSA
jgi:hypothetical protein